MASEFVNTRAGNQARKMPPRVDVLETVEEARKAVKGAILKNLGVGEPAAKAVSNRPTPIKPVPAPAATAAAKPAAPAASVATKPPAAATTSKPLPQSGQAKPESVKPGTGKPKFGQAKPESIPAKKASNKPVSSKPKRPRGLIGAASNRDLPGRTTITYAKKADGAERAARRAKLVAAAKAHSASDYRRGGAAARSRAMNRNK